MKKLGIYIFLFFVSSISFGQITLKGVVIDSKSKEALPYVNYYIGYSAAGMTDDSGRFEFNVNAKTDSVLFTYLGYKDEVLRKRFFKKDSIIVKMHPDNFILEEFTVKARRKKIPKDTVAMVLLFFFGFLETLLHIKRTINLKPTIHINLKNTKKQ